MWASSGHLKAHPEQEGILQQTPLSVTCSINRSAQALSNWRSELILSVDAPQYSRSLILISHDAEVFGEKITEKYFVFICLKPAAKVDQETLTEMVKPSIDYMRHKRFRSGNYPSSLSNETDRLVHWCHGAPGVIHTLMQAYKVGPAAAAAQMHFSAKVSAWSWDKHICLKTGNLLKSCFY